MKHVKTFEGFINEGSGYGPKAKKFIKALDPDEDGLYMMYSDIMGDDDVEHIVKKHTTSLKAADSDIAVVSSDLTEESFEWDEIVEMAKKHGLKFVEFDYDYDGYAIDAIAFSVKQ